MLRWQSRRATTARRWGAAALAAAPVVIGNAMPKSGSHLLAQVLHGFVKIGPFVNPGMPPLNRSAQNKNLGEPAILQNLARLQPGDIAYSYLHASALFIEQLGKPGVAAFFVYRDPRDVIVSHIFYAMDLHAGHGMHRYYQDELNSMEQRINTAIRGVQEPHAKLSSIYTKYEKYLGWLDQPFVMSLRFEDLVLDRQSALARMLDHLALRGYDAQPRQQSVAALESALNPRASGTFRKGTPGEWREHFTPANIEIFKSETGDLLQRLGYEKDAAW
jgi:hypothetical protein